MSKCCLVLLCLHRGGEKIRLHCESNYTEVFDADADSSFEYVEIDDDRHLSSKGENALCSSESALTKIILKLKTDDSSSLIHNKWNSYIKQTKISILTNHSLSQRS